MKNITLTDLDRAFDKFDALLMKQDAAQRKAAQDDLNATKIENYFTKHDLGKIEITKINKVQRLAIMAKIVDRPYANEYEVEDAFGMYDEIYDMLCRIDHVRTSNFKVSTKFESNPFEYMSNWFTYSTDKEEVFAQAAALYKKVAPHYDRVYNEVMAMEPINEPTDDMFIDTDDNNGVKAIEGGQDDIILETAADEEDKGITEETESFLASTFNSVKKVATTVYNKVKTGVKKAVKVVKDVLNDVEDFLAKMFVKVA